jgi:hypothetical protein
MMHTAPSHITHMMKDAKYLHGLEVFKESEICAPYIWFYVLFCNCKRTSVFYHMLCSRKSLALIL